MIRIFLLRCATELCIILTHAELEREAEREKDRRDVQHSIDNLVLWKRSEFAVNLVPRARRLRPVWRLYGRHPLTSSLRRSFVAVTSWSIKRVNELVSSLTSAKQFSPYSSLTSIEHHSAQRRQKIAFTFNRYFWHCLLNLLIATLKPQSNGPLYGNIVIGTLAVDGWAVTFGTARRGLAGAQPAQAPPRCAKCNSPPINGQCTYFVLFDIAR